MVMSQSKRVNEFVLGLKNKNDQIRIQTIHEVTDYLHDLRDRDDTNIEMQEFCEKLNSYISDLCASSDSNDRKAGIIAILILIQTKDLPGEPSMRHARFINHLRASLLYENVEVMEMVAFAIGKVALVSGSYTAQLVNDEMGKITQWLTADRPDVLKKHAAVLILKELADNASTFFFLQVQQFFSIIFIAVRDAKATVRECAAAALRSALIVISQRESKESLSASYYRKCFAEAEEPFDDVVARDRKMSRDDWIHGSFLVLNELLRCSNIQGEELHIEVERFVHQKHSNHPKLIDLFQTRRKDPKPLTHSNLCRDLLCDNFSKICDLALKQRQTRNQQIQQILLQIIPRLATYYLDQPSVFVQTYLDDSFQYIRSFLKRDRVERPMAFQALGLLSYAVKGQINQYLKQILAAIRQTLPPKEIALSRKRTFAIDASIRSVFACICFLARGLGVEFIDEVRELLDRMINCGLSTELTMVLKDLTRPEVIPELKSTIHELLLKQLSMILLNEPLEGASSPSSTIERDIQGIQIALQTLGQFEFETKAVIKFAKYCSERYLLSDYKEVRKEAVRTCAHLLMPCMLVLRARGNSADNRITMKATLDLVYFVLQRLLQVGIADQDAEIRRCVFECLLKGPYDRFLAQPNNLSLLFFASNDENLTIREYSIRIIGRLGNANPAYVMPPLRKTLLQLLTELEYGGLARNKEQAAATLNLLIQCAPQLLRPYMNPVLKSLLPKLSSVDENIVIVVLEAVGSLAKVCGSEMKQHAEDNLLALIIRILNDTNCSPAKTEAALSAVSEIIGGSGLVVQPYNEFPGLLDTLLTFLRVDQSVYIRRNTLKVIGQLGALDPYQYRSFKSDSQKALTEIKMKETGTASEMFVSMNLVLEEFYPAIAISLLMRILRESVDMRVQALQSMSYLVHTLGARTVHYLYIMMPTYIEMLSVLRTPDGELQIVFRDLALIIKTVTFHICSYLEQIFKSIASHWVVTAPFELQIKIIELVQATARALGTDLRCYVPQILPQFVKCLINDKSRNLEITEKLLEALKLFGPCLDEYLHLVIPPILKVADSTMVALHMRRLALETIVKIGESVDMSEFSSRIVLCALRSIERTTELRKASIDILCMLMKQMTTEFRIYVPIVNKVISRYRIDDTDMKNLTILLLKVQREFQLCEDSWRPKHPVEVESLDLAPTQMSELPKKRPDVFWNTLQTISSTHSRVSREDWLQWLRGLRIELIRQSPSLALRSCLGLAETYDQLAKDLFNAAFVSCWVALTESQQDELIDNIKSALSENIPDITQPLLNLTEFMEHCDISSLPLNCELLGLTAISCQAYAKALHYKEEEFLMCDNPTPKVLEALISINNRLQQPEAAQGVLMYTKKHKPDADIDAGWYEELQDWESAFEVYERRLQEGQGGADLAMGQMRCLEAMGHWEDLCHLNDQYWNTSGDEERSKMAEMSCAAAWSLRDWDQLDKYCQAIDSETFSGSLYRAAVSMQKESYNDCQLYIVRARDNVDSDLIAMMGESYSRLYPYLVKIQMLTEMEEAISYKLMPDRRETITEMWNKRLASCEPLVDTWLNLMRVHSLVMSPNEDMATRLKFSSLCLDSNRTELSYKTLIELFSRDPVAATGAMQFDVSDSPALVYAFLKHKWKTLSSDVGSRKLVYEELDLYVRDKLILVSGVAASEEMSKLLSRCYSKLGDWHETLNGITEESIPRVLEYFNKARSIDCSSHKAWHSWAYMNYEAVQFYKNKAGSVSRHSSSEDGGQIIGRQSSVQENLVAYCVECVKGIFKSISLSPSRTLQDTLRLLTLIFEHGQLDNVYEALLDGIRSIPIDNWIQVIPQLIARIDIIISEDRPLVGKLIHQLLVDIGKQHPQALVYPLTVASKSTVATRQSAAQQILNEMETHSPNLVKEAILVSDELIRVAILWQELWHEGLEEASRLWFGDQNFEGMMSVLEPLHQMIESSQVTSTETAFFQTYGRELKEALSWCRRYRQSKNSQFITQAWDSYYHVFRRISKQLPQLTSLELMLVSPKLLRCSDLELAVPGTYEANKPVIRIQGVKSSLQVITSKQRPRKISIFGSDGKEYQFLLKGHEDLRQDERVMQLFSLVNSLLVSDRETCRRNLTIERFSVIPLSTNSGLIGWVPHCDTLHQLIRDHREKRNVMVNIEHKLMLRTAPDYDHLPLMQKVEVFEIALGNCKGDDLAKILWHKSPNSEVLFERRTNYTRSLAVMSMVGYVLGLGDRHPSNLMLERYSGKIIHIDFGDCFEVAMTREKFPEKIPFRLTRMLRKAMEVTGIDGTYKLTCERVMNLLRENRDSIMAVLEAFVYDPLCNWRLVDVGQRNRSRMEDSIEENVLETETGDMRQGLPENRTGELIVDETDVLNRKAVKIINRVRDKLTGRDFKTDEPVDAEQQVGLLISQATSHENLCQCYIGWCPFW